MDPLAAPTDIAARLTRAALRLLDITFEPASVSSGERFDLVLESLSDDLSDAATAVLAAGPQPRFRPPSLPQVPTATTRRAQAALRRAVEEGRLPGSTRTLRTCRDTLLDVQRELRELTAVHHDLAEPMIGPCADALGRLAHVVDVYASAHSRISASLATPGCSRDAAADAATRAERALLRCLDRCGDARVLR